MMSISLWTASLHGCAWGHRVALHSLTYVPNLLFEDFSLACMRCFTTALQM